MISHSKKIGLMIALVLIVFVLLVLLAEGLLRVKYWINDTTPSVDDILHFDSKMCLPVPKPGAVFRGVRINSLGFRGPEFSSEKPNSTIRLAFLGASTTFCTEVTSNETTWPHFVWKTLHENNPTIQFDYVNAAVPGYIVADSLDVLKHRVKPLNPDVIIIYGHETNDLIGDLRMVAARTVGYERPVPQSEKKGISKYLMLFGKFKKAFNLLFNKMIAINRYKKHIEFKYEPEQISTQFRDGLRSLIKESQKTAKLVVVATFSYKIRREQPIEEQLENMKLISYYVPFIGPEGLIKGYEEYNRVVREVAKETGALLVEKEFDIPGNDDYFTDTVHFNDNGSRLMAKRVSEALLKDPLFNEITANKKLILSK